MEEKPVKIGRDAPDLGGRMTADSSGNYDRHASGTNVAAASPPSEATPAAAVGKRAPANSRKNDDIDGRSNKLELVLTPPLEAVIICLQSVVRGMLTRFKYRTLKVGGSKILGEGTIRGGSLVLDL